MNRIEIGRAQALLIRFSSDALYKECKDLRVRQIYILKAAIAVNKRTIKSREYENF